MSSGKGSASRTDISPFRRGRKASTTAQGGIGLGLSLARNWAALLGGRIYFDVGIDRVLARALTVTIIASLASLYPAWQASKREPAEALHYV